MRQIALPITSTAGRRDIEQDFAPKGLSEDTVRFISAKKNEPEWMLDWRLKAYRHWLTMTAARLGQARRPADRLSGRVLLRRAQGQARRSARSTRSIPRSCAVYEKLGIPIEEQKVLAGRRGRAQGRGRCGVRFRSRSRPPSARSWRRRASSSARSARRSANIPIWCGAGSARSCRCTTITSRRSTARSFPTAPSSTFPRACAARWSCRPISASMPRIPASSSAR